MKRFILVSCAAVLLAGVAVAQTANTNPPLPPSGEAAGGPDGPDAGPQEKGWGWRHHGRHHGGSDMMMKGKGFVVMAGRGHVIHVNCGEEPMKDCIAAAQPLIDAFNKADGKAP